MQASNLTLQTYFTEKLSWQIVPEFEVGKTEFPTTLDCADIEWNVERGDVDLPNRRAAYRLSLRYEPRPEKAPYAWEIALVGYFVVAESFPEADMETFMNGNSPAVLYGAARESLRLALSAGPFPVPILPGVHFAALSFQGDDGPEQSQQKPKKPRKKKALS